MGMPCACVRITHNAVSGLVGFNAAIVGQRAGGVRHWKTFAHLLVFRALAATRMAEMTMRPAQVARFVVWQSQALAGASG